MKYVKPIYQTRVDVQFSSDKIRPYGERMNIYLERKREAVRRRLLGIKDCTTGNDLVSDENESQAFSKMEDRQDAIDMLQNTRRYLTFELKKTLAQISQDEEIIKRLKEKKAEEQEILEAHDARVKAKDAIYGNTIVSMMVMIFVICLIFAGSLPSTIIGIILSIGAGFGVGCPIAKFMKVDNNFKDICEKKHCEYNDINQFESEQHKDTIQTLFTYESNLSNKKEYIKVLWDCLSSDDFVNSVIKYSKRYPEFANALNQEWYAYLEELENIFPEEVYLNTKPLAEECYAESTEKLYIDTKQLEKAPHHPLSIY